MNKSRTQFECKFLACRNLDFYLFLFTVILPIPTTVLAPKKALNYYLLNENRLNPSSLVDLYSSVCEGGWR